MEFLKIGYVEKNHVVKVRNFPGANVENMRHNLIQLIRKKPSHLIIHAGTNDAKKFGSIIEFKKIC